MAGWYAKYNCEGFYRQVWSEELVRKELRALVDDSWMRDLTALASDSP